jgi:acetyl-CoA/propionyl-CoA carboxylase carboxyl transferase subunit
VTILGSRNQAAPVRPPLAALARAAVSTAGQGSPSATITRDPVDRLKALFDQGTMRLLAPHDASGAAAARGQISGMPTVGFASDPQVQGGAMGTAGCATIVAAYSEALARGVPVIGLWHSGGARLREGVGSLHAVGTVFAAMTRASGVIPQISVVLGAAAGGAAYGPALTDLVILSEQGRIFVTGPDVVRSVTGEDVDMATLGGPELHSTRSGVAHVVAPSDSAAIAQARDLAWLLGSQGRIDLTMIELDRIQREATQAKRGGNPGPASPADFLPESARRAYDVKPVIGALLDGPGVELHARWAPNVVTMLGRVTGRTVGVVANNPLRRGGCLDTISAEKAARFVRMCDAFGVPLVVLVDVPGYLPGLSQEYDGVVRRGAKLLHAFAEACVPRVTLITRKAYGGAYIAMNSRALGATKVFAWPAAEIAVMGPIAAVRILHRRTLAGLPPDQIREAEADLAAQHEREAGGLDRACALGVVDEIIDPALTKEAIAYAIDGAAPGRGGHGNIPL